jgi:hypothetical protein
MIRRNLLFLLVVLVACSCAEEVAPNVHAYDDPADFDQVFDTFWIRMDQNYVFWDIDTTHWDDVYATYKPLFHELDIRNAGDVQQATDYFRQMTSGLVDGHYVLQFTSEHLPGGSVIDPAFERKQRASDYRGPFNFQNIVRPYLDEGYQFARSPVSSLSAETLSTISGTINREILYFSCNTMHLAEAYFSTSENASKTVITNFLDNLSDPSLPAKGVIIDLRGNNGGTLADLNFLLSFFTAERKQFGYTHYRSGPDRLDFTPWIDSFVNPDGGTPASDLPVILLGDRYTASEAELIIAAFQTDAKNTFVGETTYGATGIVTMNELYAAGSFKVGNFLNVQASAAAFRSLSGKRYERVGIDPDIAVPFNSLALANGTDLQLEKAISMIRR